MTQSGIGEMEVDPAVLALFDEAQTDHSLFVEAVREIGIPERRHQEAADYERIRCDDRLSLLDLKGMASGKAVECRIRHANGTSETLRFNHTFSTPQLEWFRKGSALNLFHH